jgi:hypothetical protein
MSIAYMPADATVAINDQSYKFSLAHMALGN